MTDTRAAVVAERVQRSSGGAVHRRDAREHAMAHLVAPGTPPLVPAVSALPAPSLVRVPAPIAVEDNDRDADERDEDTRDDGAERDLVAGGAAPPPPPQTTPRVQRTSLPELVLAMTSPDRGEDGGLLVDDDTPTLLEGQMKKRDFMRLLRDEVRRVAHDELSRVGRSSTDCPYIEDMLARYDRRTAAEIERAVRRYAPEARYVREASQYIPYVTTRLARGIQQWAKTGRMPDDLPSDEIQSLSRAGGWIGAFAGLAGVPPPEEARRENQPQRTGLGASPGRVDAGALVARLGRGTPLDGSTRSRMERGFGHSFADVQIHADERAAGLNRELSARAFTIGTHVALGADAPAPGTIAGDALLAHELAHVIQQASNAPTGDVPIGEANDPLEHDADDAAATVVAQLHGADPAPRARPRRRGRGLRLQRCGPSYHPRTPADLEQALPIVRQLRTRFNVGVTEDGANWSADELQTVSDALAMLDGPELAQLNGVTFVRIAETGVQTGAGQADAYHRIEVTRGPPPRQILEVRVANSASNLTSHDLRTVLVHELGHVIEMSRFVTTTHAVHLASVEVDTTFDAVNPAHRALGAALTTADNQVAGYSNDDMRASRAFRDAMNTCVDAYNALFRLANADTSDADLQRDRAARETAMTNAVASRDAAYQQLAQNAPANPAVNDFRPVIAAFDAAVAAVRTYIAARARRIAAVAAREAAVVTVNGAEISTRLRDFMTIVDREGYGPLRWPGQSGDSYTALVLRNEGRARFYQEMFAEAFAMWRVDRRALRDQAPELAAFFDRGDHLR